jgi:hypothetical protein
MLLSDVDKTVIRRWLLSDVNKRSRDAGKDITKARKARRERAFESASN